jgi:hypothetical protein
VVLQRRWRQPGSPVAREVAVDRDAGWGEEARARPVDAAVRTAGDPLAVGSAICRRVLVIGGVARRPAAVRGGPGGRRDTATGRGMVQRDQEKALP